MTSSIVNIGSGSTTSLGGFCVAASAVANGI